MRLKSVANGRSAMSLDGPLFQRLVAYIPLRNTIRVGKPGLAQELPSRLSPAEERVVARLVRKDRSQVTSGRIAHEDKTFSQIGLEVRRVLDDLCE